MVHSSTLRGRAGIITDIDESCFAEEEKRRLFYVACSRATHRLSLFVTGDDQKIVAIANVINDKSRFAAKGQIAMKTQATILDLERMGNSY